MCVRERFHHLENYLDDASDNGELEELDSCKHFNPLIEQLLNVAQEAAVHGTTAPPHTHTHTHTHMLLNGCSVQALLPHTHTHIAAK